MIDILLRGGMVVDGTGAEPFRADLAITDDTIEAVGVLDAASARTIIDCTDLYVMPGFVDSHSHAEGVVFDPDVQEALLRQGVTTIVGGQDGVSFAPGESRYATEYFRSLNGVHPYFESGSVSDLLDSYRDRPSPINVAYLIPQGVIRHAVMGFDQGPPSAVQLREMQRLVADGMEQGAVGMSSGMDYVPGASGGPDEISALCDVVRAHGGVYVSHLRGGYETRSPIGVAEIEDVMSQSHVKGHISHYHGPASMLLPLIDDARSRGHDVTFDSYPYRRGFTLLRTILLPLEVQYMGVSTAAIALSDPTYRRRLARESSKQVVDRFGGDTEWAGAITIAHSPHSDHAWLIGKTLAQAAQAIGEPPLEFAFRLMSESSVGVSAIFSFSSSTAEDIAAISRHKAHMPGSDGIYIGANPHPRGWGTFARLLGHHTRERQDWTWGQAALHMSGRPARRFQLGNRGEIRPKAIADLVVLDPESVSDHATYANPRQTATGVHHVLVEGKTVLARGHITRSHPGAGIRRT